MKVWLQFPLRSRALYWTVLVITWCSEYLCGVTQTASSLCHRTISRVIFGLPGVFLPHELEKTRRLESDNHHWYLRSNRSSTAKSWLLTQVSHLAGQWPILHLPAIQCLIPTLSWFETGLHWERDGEWWFNDWMSKNYCSLISWEITTDHGYQCLHQLH